MTARNGASCMERVLLQGLADTGCEGCGEPVYLTRGFGYSHCDTTLNVRCDARPNPNHPSVPKSASQGLAEPPPELVWRHLVKRMFDECGSQKANDFIRRVETGEHDVPSPWSQLATPTPEAAATELPSIVPTDDDVRNAQSFIAKNSGYNEDVDGWQEVLADWGSARDVLMYLANTKASLEAHKRELFSALQRLAQVKKERDEARLAVITNRERQYLELKDAIREAVGSASEDAPHCAP